MSDCIHKTTNTVFKPAVVSLNRLIYADECVERLSKRRLIEMLIAKHKRLFSGLLQRYDELIKALGSKLWGDILMC